MTKRLDQSTIILACAWLLAFATYCPMLCIPPMVHIIKQELQVSHAAIGLLFSIPIAMLVVLAIPGGCLGDKIGTRKTVAIGAAVMAAGGLMRGLAGTFYSLLAFTALFGLGYSILFPNLPKIVGVWFPPEKAGLATGVYATGITVGGALALAITLPVVFPLFNTIQGTFFIWALPAGLGAILWLILAKEPPAHPPLSAGMSNVKGRGSSNLNLWKDKNMWSIAILLFLNNIHFYTWAAWTPSLLMMKGASPDLAAFIASSRGWASLPTMFLMPWASYKIGLRKPFMWGSAILLIVASLAAVYMPVSWGWALMAVVGVATSGSFAMMLALPIEMLPRESVGMASGTMISIGYVGGLAGPWLAGRILDSTGSLDVALVILMAAAVLWAVVGFIIPETGKRARAW